MCQPAERALAISSHRDTGCASCPAGGGRNSVRLRARAAAGHRENSNRLACVSCDSRHQLRSSGARDVDRRAAERETLRTGSAASARGGGGGDGAAVRGRRAWAAVHVYGVEIPGAPNAAPAGINNRGEIVLTSLEDGGRSRAFLRAADGKVTETPDSGGSIPVGSPQPPSTISARSQGHTATATRSSATSEARRASSPDSPDRSSSLRPRSTMPA